MKIEAISIFLKIDCRTVLAPIAPESGELFMGMLPAFQNGSPIKPTVYVMPEEVIEHVEAAGRALRDVLYRKSSEPVGVTNKPQEGASCKRSTQ